MALHLPIGRFKTRSGLEPVPRCEPSTYQPLRLVFSQMWSILTFVLRELAPPVQRIGENGCHQEVDSDHEKSRVDVREHTRMFRLHEQFVIPASEIRNKSCLTTLLHKI